ncbi:DUF2267 domain-containing protein [Anabaena sp. UHCC 0451]|uniref:DUF2267 domain-containing protein n=1 Tax=Anabaena sp. UHCC 0451 TaxID=2055235 RepID=UPI002B1F58E2|nr:DUF2267 domain-containing protein [Anabaena sp. UHCC 0451]MEA5577927.1 DUF2267 domain-containing protein [Anabaena sp. UHCC 0451]
MEYTEFITHVQSLAQSNSREEAEIATRATLETLKELIPGDEAQEIAGEIPSELSECLHKIDTDTSESFHLQEFIERTSQKENIEPTTTAMHVRAVFAVLQNAVTPEKFKKFRAYFSHDYEELFTTSSTSEMPAV